MNESVDVAVIGAGHAGLNAIKEIRKTTDNYVLVNGGGLGTTCARVGCMPSKVAVHLAETYQARGHFGRIGVEGAEHLRLDQAAALEHVRDLRDTFVDLVLANTTDEMDGDHLIEGYAELVDANTIRVGERTIHVKATVVASGASSFVPAEWWKDFGEGILTVENLFEQVRLPASVAVIGLGPIGIEIGQALRRLGVEVTGVEQGEVISRIQDPTVNQEAIRILEREFPLWLGNAPRIERHPGGFRVCSGDREAVVEKLFVAVGRRPNLERLRLERLGVPMNRLGVPEHDPETLRVGNLPVFLSGDATGEAANLQRAAEQGRVAGRNATRASIARYRRRTPMAIVFSDPNIASVGAQWSQLEEARTAVSQVRFGPVGRALIMGQNRGLLRVYAHKSDGRLLGAAMVGPRCEHLAHLIAWAVANRMTAQQALDMPFYHPVIEEAFQDALHALLPHIEGRRKVFALRDLPFLGRSIAKRTKAA
jgi:dihydrolipoamide dehydrogenase